MSQEMRPPYVTFEIRAVEDRTKSQKAGHYVSKDVAYVIVTPSGSKDRIEKIAEDWLDGLEQAVAQERFSPEWLQAYRMKYKTWCETREVPEEGTPILQWPAISPAQAQAILNANVRTLEDLAVANESTLAAIGMGARALKERAAKWLQAADKHGKTGEALASLEQKVRELEEAAESDKEKIRLLEDQVKKLQQEDA